jgi:FeS assembly protein IscX
LYSLIRSINFSRHKRVTAPIAKDIYMSLYWSDAPGIAKALLAAYPDADRLAVSREDLRVMVEDLPAFADTIKPTDRVLSHVFWTWMRFADGDTESGNGRAVFQDAPAVLFHGSGGV